MRNIAMLACVLLASTATADAPKRKPSTAAERTAAAKAARELETDPIGPKADAKRKAAMDVVAAPDIQIKICANLLAPFANEKTDKHDELLQQIILSTLAFQVEQPDRAKDDQAQFLAGIQGALKAYGKIRALGEKAHSPFFDKLLDQQSHNKLDDYVRKEAAPCVQAK